MADISYTSDTPSSRGFLRAIGDFFALITESNWRVREAERLQAMSDRELAQRGLRREDIGRHVFRDLFYV
ncbi:DUF1127 domain-containing protein [Cognatishimia sp. F0-27]|uniref:DUF1127 domain-containing protein n=1 Tax=Cognatishimia sp. F0-27 TaxID=2816855 RepID=UPI001D0C01C1|nr:DUF1127 domain-containing protein [Cognatishimia sp. F0-27]MCC1494910.1 DUF1127 domain-containing protein [Cognatishimia sp. F0-27]